MSYKQRGPLYQMFRPIRRLHRRLKEFDSYLYMTKKLEYYKWAFLNHPSMVRFRESVKFAEQMSRRNTEEVGGRASQAIDGLRERLSRQPFWEWFNEWTKDIAGNNRKFIIRHYVRAARVLERYHPYRNATVAQVTNAVKESDVGRFIRSYWRSIPYPMTYSLIAVNGAIFLIWSLAREGRYWERAEMYMSPTFISLAFMWRHFSLSWDKLRRGYWHTLILCNFSHNHLTHALFNGVTLFFFGRMLESELGGKQLFAIYMLCGMVGSLVQAYTMKEEDRGRSPCLGASAAIYGLMMMAVCRNPGMKVALYGVVQAPLGLVLALLFLYENLIPQPKEAGSTGHFGGIIAGALLHFLIYRV